MASEDGQTTAVRTIGRYRAFDELGRGAMGVVYRGFDPIIGRTVALKTLLLDGADAEAREFRDRLYREAAAAGALSHPNIVTIFDIVEDGGTTAVAMEFIEGRSLASIIAERAPLPFDVAVDLFDQIASALDYAGSHGIVHRDIKPANILITPAAKVKITDFGVAKLALSTMTQAGTVVGSPSYMTPEQVRGLPLDGRSDLFSAAVVFYEMITRERPFAGNNVATTMYRIAHEPPTPPGQFNPSIGTALVAVLDRALAKNAADRYQTGDQLAAELRRAVGAAAAEAARHSASAGLSTVAIPPPPPVPPIVVPGPAPAAGTPLPAVPGSAPLPVVPTAAVSQAGHAPLPAIPTSPGVSPVEVPLPSIPLPTTPLQTPQESGGIALAPIPQAGPAAPAAVETPAALPALPPGAATAPKTAGRPSSSKSRVPIIAGAAVLFVVVGATAGILLMRRGTPADATEPTATETPAAAAATMPTPESPPQATPPPVSTATPAGQPRSTVPAPPPAPAAAARPATPRSAAGGTAARPAARTEPAASTAGRQDEAVRVPPPGSGKVYNITDVDVKPQVVQQASPAYPPEAAQRRLEDIVIVNALVGASGRVEDVKVIRPSAKLPAFDAAAAAAVRQYQFSPARKGGQPVRCWFSVGIPFQLGR